VTLHRLPFDKAVRTMLEAATGKPVGLYQLPTVPDPADPENSRLPVDPPYYVLYALPADFSGPPFGDDHADVVWGYQLTCVAERADQAMWLRDHGADAFLARQPGNQQAYLYPITVAGMTVMWRRAEDESPPDDADGVLSYPQRYAIAVTPA
jgi:hypothetical protein